jgi:hypothetical protein
MEDDLNFMVKEEDFNLLANGRRPQFVGNWNPISIFGKIEDDHVVLNRRRPQLKVKLA